MYTQILYLLLLAASSLSVSVIQNATGDSCSVDQWKCDDGTCISTDAKWNDILKCQNNSDQPNIFRRNTRQAQQGMCVLPEYPDHGTYYVPYTPNARPGDAYNQIFINVTCNEGFAVNAGPALVTCINGEWSQPTFPKCVSQCYLPSHPSVEFHCVVSGEVTGFRICGEYEINGTVVSPRCRPNYYSTSVLTHMHCIDGIWDNIASSRCHPECGTVSSTGTQLVVDGTPAARAEVPWHIGIYSKTMQYLQICGGSLISSKFVLSAAHCFWNTYTNKPKPAADFAVAAGKLHRPWNKGNEDAQRSDVQELHLPTLYQDDRAHFQEDIAVVVVTMAFNYTSFIRPVCINFDKSFENRQLKDGNKGKIAGWGYTDENGNPSEVLNVIELPYISVEKCVKDAPEQFAGYITSDKICAGFKNEHKALCRGDSGGGLAFPERERGETHYYLRGIASTSPTNENVCNADFYIAFTKISGVHEEFIKRFWVNEDTLEINTQRNNRKGVTKRPQQGMCILPDNPANGAYITNTLDAKPGDAFDSLTINVKCQQGYVAETMNSVSCQMGRWTGKLPTCNVVQCQLKPHPSVEYRCPPIGNESYRPCNEVEVAGTVVIPQCRSPGYYSATALSSMNCIEGKWDYVPKCSQECGTVIPDGVDAHGISARRAEVPWHAGIYTKRKDPYVLVCGGSLIRNNIIISAARFFWSSSKGTFPAANYAAAVGKLFPSWGDSSEGAQQSDVKEIQLAPSFQAEESFYYGDIAVVIVTEPFAFNDFVRPVCVNFDVDFEKQQLQTGKIGKLAGWDFNSGNDKSVSQELQVIDLPYVEVVTCLTTASSDIRQFFTKDKICAGYANVGKRTCDGYIGSGLVFPAFKNGTRRYYLRGVLSASSLTDNVCSVNSYSVYTKITAHEHLIRNILEDYDK